MYKTIFLAALFHVACLTMWLSVLFKTYFFCLDLLIFVSEKGPLIFILNGVNMSSTTNTDEFDNQNQCSDSCKGDAHNERQNATRYNVKHFNTNLFQFSFWIIIFYIWFKQLGSDGGKRSTDVYQANIKWCRGLSIFIWNHET